MTKINFKFYFSALSLCSSIAFAYNAEISRIEIDPGSSAIIGNTQVFCRESSANSRHGKYFTCTSDRYRVYLKEFLSGRVVEEFPNEIPAMDQGQALCEIMLAEIKAL